MSVEIKLNLFIQCYSGNLQIINFFLQESFTNMIKFQGFDAKKYDMTWFTTKAHSSLYKIQDGVFDYSYPCLEYLPVAADHYEQKQESGNPYEKLVTTPEKEFLIKIAKDLISFLPKKYEYIDLGPGSAHKEQYFFDELFKTDKEFVYKPVDIYQRFLEMSATYAADQKIKVDPILSSFEELPEVLPPSSEGVPRFVSLGLTVSNYHPDDILPLMKKIAGENGCVFVDIQVRERLDMTEMLKGYADLVNGYFNEKLKLIGIAPEDLDPLEIDDKISVSATLKKSNPILEAKGMRVGDKLVIFQSLRHTEEYFTECVSKYFKEYEKFDTGSSFIGYLLMN